MTDEEIAELFIQELSGTDKSITTVRYDYELEISEKRIQSALQARGFWVCKQCYDWAHLTKGRCKVCNEKFFNSTGSEKSEKRGGK